MRVIAAFDNSRFDDTLDEQIGAFYAVCIETRCDW